MNINAMMVFVCGFWFLVGFGLVGWVKNIFDLIANDNEIGMLVARIAGIFIAPLGAVLGYF